MTAVDNSGYERRMDEDDFQAVLGRGLRAVETEPNEPSTDNSQGRLARKVIAALRKGGIGCCLVISESDDRARQ